MDTDFSLKGEVALVTGSGRGLGHAIAVRLAELGADVAIHDYDEKAPAEFNEFRDLKSALAPVARHGTKTHVVVGDIGASGGKPNPNNALHVTLEDIRALLNRNLVGTMLMCQAIVCGMVDRKNGAVVNIASTAGHFGTSPEVAYSTIKAAIVHYTRCLAYETRKHHVRVNCVSPGATATARFLATRKIDAAMLKEDGTLERYGVPRDQANAVAFLCTPAAKYIHGQVLRVDGGLTLYAG
ncbi:MAG: SDR family NAD(P)-dependent oxidoreductase [Gemmatimonadaceae bacterium]